MILGYNTNGFAHHSLEDALIIMAELGYRAVALTPDVHHLNPNVAGYGQQLKQTRSQLKSLGLICVIETGSRFLLDSRRKHQPTLLSKNSEDRQQRIDFLKTCVDMASALDAEVVSLWSGSPDHDLPEEQNWSFLVDGLNEVCDYANQHTCVIGFEPEPGMFIETMDQYSQLINRLDHPALKLTLDVGHLQCVEDIPWDGWITQFADQLVNVHLDDMKQGVHDHLMFGEGEIDFSRLFSAIKDIQYDGPMTVELSRHSHNAPQIAREAMAFMQHYSH